MRELAVKLLLALVHEAPHGSTRGTLLLSPSSLATVLQMLWLGAAGPTRRTLSQALGLGLHLPMAIASHERQLTTRTAVWTTASGPPSDRYRRAVEQCCAAEFRVFGTNPVPSINAWVAQATDGRIPSIVDQLHPDVRLFMVNAIHFKGRWAHPFSAEATATGAFLTAAGARVPCQFMHRQGHITAARRAGHWWIRLPYADSGMALDLWLPDAGIDTSTLIACLATSPAPHAPNSHWARLAMPRVTGSTGLSLRSSLGEAGLGALFQSGRADLSGIGAGISSIDEMRQAAMLRIDEAGTEAAAATSAAAFGALPQTQPPLELTLNRPFLAALVDTRDDMPMMVALVRNPAAG